MDYDRRHTPVKPFSHRPEQDFLATPERRKTSDAPSHMPRPSCREDPLIDDGEGPGKGQGPDRLGDLGSHAGTAAAGPAAGSPLPPFVLVPHRYTSPP
jgi:hypothetical protein